MRFLQDFEGFRNRLSVVDHHTVTYGESRGLPSALAQPSMRHVLVHALRVSPAEAARRVTSAAACAARVSVHGEVLAPARPHLAAGVADGTLSAEQTHIVASALAKVDRPGIDPADVEAGERLLADFATTFGTKDLKHLAERTVAAIDTDGTLPDEQLNADRRHFSLKPCRDGMYAGDFRLTGAAGAKLASLLQPLAQPRLDTIPRADGSFARELDGRTYGQRSHDALEEICDRVLAAGDVMGTGGTPATVIVTVTMDDLTDRLGYATTSDGALLSIPEVLRLAQQAEVMPAVMNQSGAVLALGRTRRIASTPQTHALIARDHGCSFPSCDRPPEWCERHHIVEWFNGGLTDLDNLTLLCRYHHHNFAARGWTCSLNSDGLPQWRPPRWLDRERRPLMNSRIRAHQLSTRAPFRRPPSRLPGPKGRELVGAAPGSP